MLGFARARKPYSPRIYTDAPLNCRLCAGRGERLALPGLPRCWHRCNSSPWKYRKAAAPSNASATGHPVPSGGRLARARTIRVSDLHDSKRTHASTPPSGATKADPRCRYTRAVARDLDHAALASCGTSGIGQPPCGRPNCHRAGNRPGGRRLRLAVGSRVGTGYAILAAVKASTQRAPPRPRNHVPSLEDASFLHGISVPPRSNTTQALSRQPARTSGEASPPMNGACVAMLCAECRRCEIT